MVSAIFKAPASSGTSSSVALFDETDPIRLWPHSSVDDIETLIRAVYRQVLGNAYVMESERLVVPESQLRRRELSVREFVRRVAKSELYRSRFFDSCYRYRAIELNFKHLLGRAPNDFDEMRHHSTILDADGFEAEIDSYIDSDEYCHHFGDDIVPYYRGYKTQTGQSMLEFTNMLQLMRSASSSDKDVKSGNRARLTRSLILNRPYGIVRSTDSKVLLAQLFGSNVPHEMASEPSTDAALYRQEQEQNALIASLQQQLADLRPFGAIGSAVIRQGKFASAAVVDPQATLTSGSSALQQTIADQQALIASLQAEIAEARSLAAIGEARLNKWRQRTFF